MTTTKRTTAAATGATTGGDAYARCRTGSAAGRGSISGWTPCPLCTSSSLSQNNNIVPLLANNYFSCGVDTSTTDDGDNSITVASSSSSANPPLSQKQPKSTTTKSVKLYSHGRGLSAHLHAVHTPWNPGKAELKRREAYMKRMENEARRKQSHTNNNISNKKRRHCEIDADDDEYELRTCHYLPTPKNGGKWEPTEDEIKEWNQRVVEIVSLVEEDAKMNKGNNKSHLDDQGEVCGPIDGTNNTGEKSSCEESTSTNGTTSNEGRDRSGNVCPSYRESLPPFLAAAADGDLMALKQCVDGGCGDNHDDESGGSTTKHTEFQSHHTETSLDNNSKQLSPSPLHHIDSNTRDRIKLLLSIRDRNGSAAEHWAAGGGHWDCVSYLLDLRDAVSGSSSAADPTDIDISASGGGAVILTKNINTYSAKNDTTTSKKIRRRRDGKTSLHYAARNGHIRIIDLLLSRRHHHHHDDIDDAPYDVDIPSGDGTTPLHMACYGGHPDAVKHLLETHSANVHALNEWECGTAHWAAMSLGNEGTEKVIELCNYLKIRGVNWVQRQKQGHTPLHKAASRNNRHVIEWLATSTLFSEEERKVMGAQDVGGNSPSNIWLSVGGEEEFGLWMKEKWNW